MNRRIAKKRAALFTAVTLSVPLTLAHARTSLWRLDRGTQRHYTYRRTVEGLGVRAAQAHRATWILFAAMPYTPQAQRTPVG